MGTLPVDEDRLASTLGIDQTSAAALAHGLGVEEGFLAAPETKSAAGGNLVLVIVSSPMEEESVTNAVSNAFLEGYKSAFPADQVETLDISAGQLQPFTASRVLAKFKNQPLCRQAHVSYTCLAAPWENILRPSLLQQHFCPKPKRRLEALWSMWTCPCWLRSTDFSLLALLA